MGQRAFSDLAFDHKKRRTRREIFLDRMDELIPWQNLESRVRRHYPRPGKGRRPYPLETMLRIHCVQLFYDLSDPAMEDMLYEIESVRRFTRLNLDGPIPDESTILNFRHLLERHNLGPKLLSDINNHLGRQGLVFKTGTAIDATIIAAPSSTKNRERKRDPEMRQVRKGRQWHFGMKAHIGADAATGLVHTLAVTPANVHDLNVAKDLLTGAEEQVWGDSAYRGIARRFPSSKIRFNVAMRYSERRKLAKDSPEERWEREKAGVRARVEHPFRDVKRRFGYGKVRYRGLYKNAQRLCLLFGFSNLLRSEGQLKALSA